MSPGAQEQKGWLRGLRVLPVVCDHWYHWVCGCLLRQPLLSAGDSSSKEGASLSLSDPGDRSGPTQVEPQYPLPSYPHTRGAGRVLGVPFRVPPPTGSFLCPLLQAPAAPHDPRLFCSPRKAGQREMTPISHADGGEQRRGLYDPEAGWGAGDPGWPAAQLFCIPSWRGEKSQLIPDYKHVSVPTLAPSPSPPVQVQPWLPPPLRPHNRGH